MSITNAKMFQRIITNTRMLQRACIIDHLREAAKSMFPSSDIPRFFLLAIFPGKKTANRSVKYCSSLSAWSLFVVMLRLPASRAAPALLA
jgi:hypothetical protein